MEFTSESHHAESYARNVYANTHLVFNESMDARKLMFFWNCILGRRNFTVVWSTIYCTMRHWRPERQLWAPIDDARWNLKVLYNTSSTTEYSRQQMLRAILATPVERVVFPGFFSHMQGPHAGLPDHTWVEVLRVTRVESKSRPEAICTVGQLWFWLASGSGIWLSTGRSLVLSPWDVQPTCAQAAANGFDTIQKPGSFQNFSFELLDCRGSRRHDANVTWTLGCPPRHVRLLSGIPRDRYSPFLAGVTTTFNRTCVCNADLHYLNCNGVHANHRDMLEMTSFGVGCGS